MPENVATAEPGQTNIGDVFPETSGDAFPNVLTPLEPAEAPEPETKPDSPPKEPPKPPKAPPAAPEPVDGVKIPDSVFDEPQKPTEPPEPSKNGEKKPVTPEDLAAFYEKHGIKGEKARENFEKQATVGIELERKAEQLERELVSERKLREQGDPNAAARIKELETRLEQVTPLAERASLEARPDFQARFTVPRAQLFDIAAKNIETAGLEPAQLEKALSLSGKSRADALDDLFETIVSPTLRGKVERAVDQIELIDTQRENVLKNAQFHNQQLAEQDRANNHKFLEKHSQDTKDGLRAAANYLRDEIGWEVLKDSDDKTWTEQRDQVIKSAEELMLNTTDPSALHIASILASSAPIYRKIVIAQRKEIQKLGDQLKEFQDSEPSIGGKTKSDKGGGGDENIVEDDFVKSAVRALVAEGSIKSG